MSGVALPRRWCAGRAVTITAGTFAPDQITLTFHPGQIALFASQLPQAQSTLAQGLARAIADHGLELIHAPHVTLASDPTLTSREIRAISWHSRDPLTFSALIDTPAEATDAPPPGAFLVVGGKRHFPLTQALVNIGRRLDNHLVLDDPHVSRQHAQLRSQRGKFVLVDLNSTGGTRVNGHVVRQHTLQPGDVITIAGIELIYGRDLSGPPESTPPYAPPFAQPSDRDRITPLNLRFRAGYGCQDQGPRQGRTRRRAQGLIGSSPRCPVAILPHAIEQSRADPMQTPCREM